MRCLALFMLFLVSFCSLCPVAMAGQEQKSAAYSVNASQLREAGIAVRILNPRAFLAELGRNIPSKVIEEAGVGLTAQAFPNKCFLWPASRSHLEVSLSDEFLNYYRRGGFTKDAVCLGIYSYWISFDSDTGAPLRSLRLGVQINGENREIARFLLDIPNCFSKGNPLHDCSFKFNEGDGTAQDKDSINFRREQSKELQKLMSAFFKSGHFARACTCSELAEKKASSGEIAWARCRPEPIEQCNMKWRDGVRPGAWLHFLPYMPQDEVKKYAGFESDYAWFLSGGLRVLISAELSRGYGSTWYIPGGEDDTPILTLAPGDRIGVGK